MSEVRISNLQMQNTNEKQEFLYFASVSTYNGVWAKPTLEGEMIVHREMKNLENSGIQLPNSSVCRILDLRQKEVINLADGRRLGFVKDAEFSLETGRIISIILPGPWSFFRFFGREAEIVIPWRDIKKVGEEIILVDIREGK